MLAYFPYKELTMLRSAAGPAAWQNDLTAIGASDWNYDFAAHLLERAGFGGTPEEIDALAKMTPREAVGAWSASKASRTRCRRSMNPAFTIPASNRFPPAGPPSPRWPRRTAKRSASR